MALSSLYVKRRLWNPQDLISWAKEQGFRDIYPHEKFHVTVAYCRKRMEWEGLEFDETPLKIRVNSKIIVLGGGYVLAVTFMAPSLETRWDYFRSRGAQWDFPTYKPHVSFAKVQHVPKGVKEFEGDLSFGPEKAEPVKAKKREPIRTPF